MSPNVGYAGHGEAPVAQSHMRKEPVMRTLRWIGLDVHVETIAIAIGEASGEIRSVGVIPNTADAVRRLVKKLGPVEELKACYEAGPTGYGLYRLLASLGVACEVVAPTLIPIKAGDRVKTDRRDAEKLARCLRAGDLTAVWVPDAAHEALRDLVRAREAAKKDELRARHRLRKFLLRHDQHPPTGVRPWSLRYLAWVRHAVHFDNPILEGTLDDYLHEVDHVRERIARLDCAVHNAAQGATPPIRALIAGLQALRGIAEISAVSLAAELGPLTRFTGARQLMGYSGLVPREASSGGRTSRGPITKTGNAHLRRIVVEAAWAYRARPAIGDALRKRQAQLAPSILAIAWKAQHRLHARYVTLLARGHATPRIATAVARELLGFIWAIGVAVDAGNRTARIA
jgi:transposase